MQQLFLKIHGDVQGVGFRYRAMEKARELGLIGWVKNAYDNTVEITAEGEDEALKKFLEWCKNGPRWARVERIEEKWGEIMKNSFDDFRIVF